MDTEIRTLDLFCGAGGSSWGARSAGASIIAGVDYSTVAATAFRRNFNTAQTFVSTIETLDPTMVKAKIGQIQLLLASPECTNHSPAKGGSPRSEKSKRTALQVLRFADCFKPRWIVIENVVNMSKWSRYTELLEGLTSLGYQVKAQSLNAADFAVPQSRKRLFVVADLEQEPSLPLSTSFEPVPAKSILMASATYAWTPLKRQGRAKATLQRAKRAIDEIGEHRSFLLVYYGTDGSGGWQTLERPLRTITTLDRFAVVRPTASGHVMRMLQVPELKAAMGMPKEFVAGLGTRRDQIRAIGNAVCPPVMTAVVRSLTSVK